MAQQPTLITERLILRAVQAADAQRIAELASDRRIAATTLNVPHPYTLDDALEFVERMAMASEDRCTFAITRREDGMVMGMTGLHDIDARHQRAEVGYWIGVPYWRQGIATEAACRLIQFGFEELKLRRIYANHFANNPASGRVMEKIGMAYEGTLRQHYERWGEFHDAKVYGILREDFNKQEP